MGRSAIEVLQLPVRLHGIRLGVPTDLLLDLDLRRAVGLVVHCGDGVERFLVLAAADVREDEIAVGSALLLLEDVAFYRTRSLSFRSLLGSELDEETLEDLLLSAGGTVTPVCGDPNAVSA